MKNIMKKVLIVDPYLDVFGGGEKHILSIGKVFEKNGYTVSLFWNDEKILNELKEKLKLDTSSFSIEREQRKGEGYDILLYVTDGSYFFPKAKKSYVFCMYPQKSLYARNLLNMAKWRGWNFFANSKYTADYISKWVGKKAEVVYPYIDESIFKQYSPIKKKKKVILSVGRFFKHLHAKNQHVIIDAFNKLQKNYAEFSDFQLVLIGSVKKEDEDYFAEIREKAKGNSAIKIIKNAPYSQLLESYKTSLFYWHAAGVRADLSSQPEGTEHLGMSVIEAMASGCITFAHNSGGPKETIKSGKTGFLYNSVDELIEMTSSEYIRISALQSVSDSAKEYCNQDFSENVFKKNVRLYFNL